MSDPDRKTRVDSRLRTAIESGTLPKELIVVGAAGTGKTFGIVEAIHTLAADYPDLRVLWVRQTRTSLTDSAMVTYEQEILPRDGMESIASGVSRSHRSSYVYPNGSEIVLGGLDKPGKVLSSAYDIAFVNEAIELQEETWETIRSRTNRPGRPRGFGWLIGDTNPGDPGHWLKKRIDDGRTPAWDTAHEANPAMHDGRDWTPVGLDYLETLRTLRGTRRKRFLEGVWAAGEGQWFESFGDGHVSVLAEFDPRYPVHLAVDSGVHTGAVWFQVRSQLVTVFGDYYSFNRGAYEAALEIRAKGVTIGVARFDRGVTDPAGGSQTGIGITVLAEYQRARLNLERWPSYPGSVLDGLTLIDSFVSVDPPGLIVHPRCTKLIEAFANYKRAKRQGQWIDRPEDPAHPHEDLLDALRGGLQDKWPAGRTPPEKMAWRKASGGRLR